MWRFLSVFCNVSGINRYVSGRVSRRALQKAPGRKTVLFVYVLCIGAYISARWLNAQSIISNESQKLTPTAKTAVHRHSHKHPKHIRKLPTNPENVLSCPRGILTRTCPANRRTPPKPKMTVHHHAAPSTSVGSVKIYGHGRLRESRRRWGKGQTQPRISVSW